jgi:hypothetical protein
LSPLAHPAHNTPPPSPPHFPPRPAPPSLPPPPNFEFRSPPPESVPLHHAHTYLLTYLRHMHLPTPPVTVPCFPNRIPQICALQARVTTSLTLIPLYKEWIMVLDFCLWSKSNELMPKCYLIVPSGKAHIRCDALQEELMWKHN